MFSQQSRYRQRAKTQREVGGTGRMLLDEQDERTAIILIICGESAVMLPVIAQWSMKSVLLTGLKKFFLFGMETNFAFYPLG